MTQPDQDDVVAFLSSGGAFDGVPVKHIETHISHLFLAGDRAWKLKRALKLNFLDFSTPELRRKTCEREVLLNSRAAPALYLGVVPVTWDGRSLAVDGAGEAIDWLVKMRRFDDSSLLEDVARRGALTPALVSALTETIISLHDGAERRPDKGGAAAIRNNARDVAENLRRFGDSLFDLPMVDAWAERIDEAFALHGGLLDRRRMAGSVRLCHGDMHLANICMLDGVPTLFDCIEFNEAISCIDVLYDLAFLLMDMISHGHAGLANLVLNRYLSATRDFAGLPAMPAFLSLRAAIRAMAAAMEPAAPSRTKEARRRLDLAVALLESPSPRLIAVGGLSGTGKSTLAAALAPMLATGAGAVVISSDVIRKRLHGRRPEETLPKAAYEPAVSEAVYRRMFEDVAAALAAGQVVIADATWMRIEDREHIARLGRDAGVTFDGLWLDSPADLLRERVARRAGDPSDADESVVAMQLTLNVGSIDWHRLDSGRPGLVADAMLALSAQGRHDRSQSR
jgi:aminoglycoside phosphotransferase family enzyme/predicted kinase